MLSQLNLMGCVTDVGQMLMELSTLLPFSDDSFWYISELVEIKTELGAERN